MDGFLEELGKHSAIYPESEQAMDGFLEELGKHSAMLIIGGTIAVCFIAMAISQALTTRASERSRRELAAYVAEGSMTADEAERILCAGSEGVASAGCCGSKKKTKRRRTTSAPVTETEHLPV